MNRRLQSHIATHDPSNGVGNKERIRSLEGDIERHQRNIDELYSNQSASARTNWQVLIAAGALILSLITVIGWLASAPLKQQTDRSEELLRALYPRIRALEDFAAASKEKDLIHAKQIDVFRTLVRRVEDDKVGAKEYARDQQSQSKDIAILQRQFDALNGKVDGLIPPQKTFEDLLARLRNLEAARSTQTTTVIKP